MTFRVKNPYTRFLDSTGEPRAGGLVTFFNNNTTVKASIFSDEALTIAQSNPYTLDSLGQIVGDVRFNGVLTVQEANFDGSDVITNNDVTTSVGGRIFVSANDTTTGYLDDKLEVGTNLVKTIVNPAGNENILIEIASNQVAGIKVDWMEDLVALDTLVNVFVTMLSFHDGLDKGWGIFYWNATEDIANHNGITIIDPTNTADLTTWDSAAQTTWFTASSGNVGCWIRVYDSPVDQLWSGAMSDDLEDDTIPNGAWLDLLIADGLVGQIWDVTTLSGELDKVTTSTGLKIIGNGIFKYTGAASTNFMKFTSVTGIMDISGITIDGNDLAKRPLEIENVSSTPTTIGTVTLHDGIRVINAKTTSPDTGDAYGVFVRGGFASVIWDGEIDGVDNTLTSGAVSQGFSLTWSGTATNDWCRAVTIGPNSKIRNVKNSNTVTADADGAACFAPVDQVASFTVSPGALFDECEGRAIKSQMTNNAIMAPIIKRSLYDGLIEIDLQYSGGNVSNARIHHDGVSTDAIINFTNILEPDISTCTITGNQLIVTGTPASDTGTFIQLFGSDVTDVIVLQGVTIRDNKVFGAVDYFATIFGSNVINTNRVIVDANWAQTVNTAYIRQRIVFNNNSQLTIVFTNNGAENQATGASIVASGEMIVEHERSNNNITSLLGNAHTVTISAGVITVYATTHRVDTEAAGSTDDLDTINDAANRGPDDWLTLYAVDSTRTVVMKDATGNLNLAGDFSLDNVQDRITLSSNGTNWAEISRSDNGA